MSSPHPYYPPDLVLEGYTPNTLSAAELIAAWLVSLSIVTVATFIWLAPKKLALTERLIALWFVSCESLTVLRIISRGTEVGAGGFIHVFFEGRSHSNFQVVERQ